MLWPGKDWAFRWLEERGVRVAALKVPSSRHKSLLSRLPFFLARLRRVVAPTDIDLVDANNYRSALVASRVSRRMGVPWVSHVRELVTPERIRQFRLESADALLAVSEAVGRNLVDGGISPDRVTVIRSGIERRRAAGEQCGTGLREGLGIDPHDPVVGIVAHILPHKGYDDLFLALAVIREKLPRIRCLIVGEAPRKRYLRQLLDLAQRLSIRDRLHLVGWQEDVFPFLQAMDLLILPSHTEGFPITILEAMAAGRPVVATAVGGIPEVVSDGETGTLVPARDPRRLAEALLRLLKAPELAGVMADEGRKRIETRFTLEREAQETSMVYRRILGDRRAHSAPAPPDRRR